MVNAPEGLRTEYNSCELIQMKKVIRGAKTNRLGHRKNSCNAPLPSTVYYEQPLRKNTH